MPLPTETADIARVLKNFTQRRELAKRVVRLRPHHIFRIEKRMHTVLRRDQSRQKRRTRRRANRVTAKSAGETHPLRRETVDIRRFNVWIAIAAERPSPLVIRQDENEIRRTVLRCPK